MGGILTIDIIRGYNIYVLTHIYIYMLNLPFTYTHNYNLHNGIFAGLKLRLTESELTCATAARARNPDITSLPTPALEKTSMLSDTPTALLNGPGVFPYTGPFAQSANILYEPVPGGATPPRGCCGTLLVAVDIWGRWGVPFVHVKAVGPGLLL